jgi:hypothetical protein
MDRDTYGLSTRESPAIVAEAELNWETKGEEAEAPGRCGRRKAVTGA